MRSGDPRGDYELQGSVGEILSGGMLLDLPACASHDMCESEASREGSPQATTHPPGEASRFDKMARGRRCDSDD
jgi:hypothetical protein